MTLFGTPLDTPAIASLVGLLATLGLWVFVLRSEGRAESRFRQWEADRKARRDAELAREKPDTPPKTRRGPWG